MEKEIVRQTITLTEELEPMIVKPEVDTKAVTTTETPKDNTAYCLEECFIYHVLSSKTKKKVGIFDRISGKEIVTTDNLEDALSMAHFLNLKSVCEFFSDLVKEEIHEAEIELSEKEVSYYWDNIFKDILKGLHNAIEGRLQSEEASARLQFEIDKHKN